MKNIFIIIALLSVTVFPQGGNIKEAEKDIALYMSNLPFKMNKITLPAFTEFTINIKDAGAKGDGVFLNTAIINKTISDCSAKGGGTVVIPEGMWLAGSIEMKSNVCLNLLRGAVVVFAEDHKEYPMITTGGKNYFVQSPIYGYKLKNIAITGEGIFNGNGQTWRPVKKNKMLPSDWKKLVASGGALNETGDLWYPSTSARDAEKILKEKKKGELTEEDYEQIKDFLRPNLLELNKCSNVWIDGNTYMNSPKFTLYIKGSDNVLIRNVNVLNEWWTQNSDGIDLSASKNVMIIKSTVNTGDDGICMKSSGKPESAPALENIVIADCIVYRAHGGFVIGSNTDGGMNNISVKNCTFIGTDIGLRFKSGIGVGGVVNNIFIDSIYMKDIVNESIIFDLNYSDAGAVKNKYEQKSESKYPYFKNVKINNVVCDGSEIALRVSPLESAFENISLNNSLIKSDVKYSNEILKGFSFKDVKFISGNITVIPE